MLKSEQNRQYLEDISQSMWEKMHNFNPKKNFQADELTTGQAAQIYGMTSSTIANYCEQGYIKGAWRDDVRKWWHIPANSLDEINAFITSHGLDWTARYWIRFYAKSSSNGKSTS